MAEDPVTQGQERIEELEKALAEEKARAEEYLAGLQRATAEVQNVKKRTEQEKQDWLMWSNAELIKALLPVVDDMERAISMIDGNEENTAWIEGFKIIQRNLQDILKAHGCTQIECLGQPFDPNLHEAIGQENGEEGIVISEQRKGYALKNKVLRASQVTVGNGKTDNENKENN